MYYIQPDHGQQLEKVGDSLVRDTCSRLWSKGPEYILLWADTVYFIKKQQQKKKAAICAP